MKIFILKFVIEMCINLHYVLNLSNLSFKD